MALLNNPNGQVVTVPVTPNMELEFGFDPGSEAQLSRDGDNLIFTFDDGGQIVLTDFYAQEIEQLPTLDIQGAQISSEDFLASLGNDALLPAAGPTAPQAPASPDSSGSGAYADAAGNLIGGVDYLGQLGRIFWVQPSGNPLTEIGLEIPGGSGEFDPQTDLGNAFAAGAFEDARPEQNLYGDMADMHPAQIHFTFVPTGTTTVTGIQLSGFDAGTRLYIGDPNLPGSTEIIVTGPSQVINFTQLQFTQNGVYMVPPLNSDHDMNIHADVNLVAVGGLTTVIPVNFTIVVDAVADLPTGISTEVTAITDSQMGTEINPSTGNPGEVKTVAVHAGATFSDVLDGTEHHFMEMRGIPSDWTIKDIPAGWVLVNAAGQPISFADVVRGEHTTYELRFDVTGAATADARAHGTLTGNVGGNVVFDPHDWTSTGATDAQGAAQDYGRWTDGTENHSGPAVIEVRGTAIDTPGDRELDLNNNTAESPWTATDPISVVEDTPWLGQEAFLNLNEQRGPQGDEVSSLGQLDPTIGDAIANALAGYTGAPENLGTVYAQNSIWFNLHSDGYDDSDKATKDAAGNPIAPSSQIALSWDLNSMPDLSAKLPEHDQYYEVSYRQSGPDANGQYTVIGYYTVNGVEHVALVGVLTPNFTTGEATVTFAQYAAVLHPDGLERNDLATNFGIKITDEDGDVALSSVSLDITDDVPAMGSDVAAVFDEKVDTAIHGNVLDKTVTDHDSTNDGAAYTKDDSGSDGWYGGGHIGVISYSVDLPTGYTLQGQTGTTDLTPGSYVILDAKSNAQGTFSLDAKGDWSFESTTGQDVIKDFDFQVTYTVKDADGDTATAKLDVDVKAAPIQVGLTGNEQVHESYNGGVSTYSTSDDPGVAIYTLQAYHYNSTTPLSGNAIYEDIIITLTVKPGTASLADLGFTLDAIQKQNAALKIDSVNPTTGEIKIRIPAFDADGKVELKLPINDDSLGGHGTTSDGPVESYTLEVTGVTGATTDHYLQPGDTGYTAGTTQHTDIIDDGAFWNPGANGGQGAWEYMDNRLFDPSDPNNTGTYAHANDAHPLDGPMIGLSTSNPSSVNEGEEVNLRLSDRNSNTGWAYADGDKERNTAEPIELTMKFSLTGGAEAADVLVKAAAVTGATYEYQQVGSNPAIWLAVPAGGLPAAAFDSNGNVALKITLATGFDLTTLKNVGLNVTAINDNLSEQGKHESFSLAITDVSGNESTYYGAAQATEILDVYNNTLTLSGTPEVWEGGTLAYKFTLNTTAVLSTTNTDPVTMVLDFSGSATFGKDYTFAELQAANPNLTLTDLGSGKVEVTIPPAQWSNQGSAGKHTYTFKVPTEHDNQIGEHNETVIIKIDSATGAEIASDGFSGTGTGTIKDDAGLSLTATDYSKVTPNIYEDASKPLAETIANYQVNFKHDTGFGSDGNPANGSDGARDKLVYTNDNGDPSNPAAHDVAATKFTFDISLKDGIAKFDANIENNEVDGGKPAPDAQIGDYGWALPTGVIKYGDLDMTNDFDGSGNPLTNAAQDYLIKEINDYLIDQGFTGIKVIDVSNHGRTLTFEVLEGADLSRPLPIHVGAIDDRISEDPENYRVILSNIKADIDTHFAIDGNKVDTTILDDKNDISRDGFLVGIGDANGKESSGGIGLPVVLFERDANGNAIDVDPNNPPSQNITVTFTAGVGDVAGLGVADLNSDYYMQSGNTTTATLAPGSWGYVPAAGGVPAHWEAKVNIPLNDDRLTEGNEDFTVQLTNVTGHESSLIADATTGTGGVDGKATLTILDDATLPGQPVSDASGGVLDGPALSYFGPTTQVIEPVRTQIDGADKDGDPINQLEYAKTVEYKVGLDQAVSQDTIAFINIKDTSWEDFKPVFGDGTGGTLGILGDGTNGTWTYAALIAAYPHMAAYGFEDGKGLDANGGGYFVIIPTGSAEGKFDVQILHDHDSANISGQGGIDEGKEFIDMNITNIQGSETTFDKTAHTNPANPTDPAYTHEEILDDMRGPVVYIDTMTQGADAERNTVTFNVKMGATATEDVTVKISFMDASGNWHNTTATIPAGQLTGTGTATVHSDYINAKIEGTEGGETQHDHHSQTLDLGYPGEGGQPLITLNVLDTDPIYEDDGDPAHPTSVTYTVEGHIPADHTVNTDLSFTLRVINTTTSDDDFVGGAPSTITVTIPKELLDTNGPDSDFKVVINPDGTVSFIDKDGAAHALPSTSTTPEAFDDTKIEGDETFETVITNIAGGGGATIGDHPIGTTTIIDDDVPTVKVVFCDKEGNILDIDSNGNPVLHGQEGHDDVYVKVILEGPDGPLTLGNGAVTFNLTPGGSALEGTDFSLTKTSVTIPNGSSESAPVRITLPDDFKSDGAQTLSFAADPDLDPTTVQNYPAGFIPGSTTAPELTIDEYINGPTIHFSDDKTTVGENGTVNYTVTLDKALEEDATLTFKVDLYQGDTKDGFTSDDIASVKIGNTTYTMADILIAVGPNAPAYINSDGDLIINMGMADRASKGTFSINLNNDNISEQVESLDVTLIGTKGGELNLGPDSANPNGNYIVVTPENGPTAHADVTDVREGPVVSLVKVDASGMEGDHITVGLNLSKATVSDTSIILKLGAGVYDNVVDANGDFKVTDALGNDITGATIVDNGNGTVTVNLPTGVAGPVHVDFPLADNAITGGANDPFSVSLDDSGLPSGEARAAGTISYGSDFVNETPSSTTFELTGTGSPTSDATAVITLTGIPGGVAGLTSVVIGGVTYSGAQLSGNGTTVTITLPGTMSSSLDGTAVQVNFNPNMSAADMASAKLNVAVSGELSGMSLTLPVTDDAGTADQDGPVFSVTSDATSVAEGSTITFTIHPEPKTGFEESEQGITLTFKLTGVLDTDTVSITDARVSGPLNGVYTATFPVGTDLNDADIAIKVTPTADSVIGADRNIGIQLDTISGGEASLSTVAGATSATTEVTDSDAHLVLTPTSLSISEGDTLGFNLSLLSATGHTAVTATEALTVAFLVSGFAPAGGDAATLSSDLSHTDITGNGSTVHWEDKGDGTWIVTATLAAGQSDLDIHGTAVADGIIEHTEGINFQLISLDAGHSGHISVTDENYDVISAGHSADFTIADGEAGHLTGTHFTLDEVQGMELVHVDATSHDYDGSGAEHGLFIEGTAAGDSIIGSSHDDIIFGGNGADILTGGLGDDIFGWHAGETGIGASQDVITDFSMTGDPHHSSMHGNDLLDLRDLISDARESTLDNYLSITHDGDNAVLKISNVPGGDATQEIVLQNVYSNHGVDHTSGTVDQDMSAVDELIKQHIILNS